jgi:hypothetical protein
MRGERRSLGGYSFGRLFGLVFRQRGGFVWLFHEDEHCATALRWKGFAVNVAITHRFPPFLYVAFH